MTEYSAEEQAYREKLISEIEALISELSENSPKPETQKPKLRIVRDK